MPGIFGIVETAGLSAAFGGEARRAFAERMAAAMTFESRYATEIVDCPTVGAIVGWVGASDLVVAGMPRPRAPLVVFTAGEPSFEVGSTPSKDPATCIGPGAEVLRCAFSKMSTGCFAELDGPFAAFVADERNTQCLLVTDRYGMERLFIHRDGDRTFFASEAKAILAVAPRTRGFDADALAEFLACGCPLGTRSLFKDIEVVEGGTVMVFRPAAGATRFRYFNASSLEEQPPVSNAEFVEGFAPRLAAAVARAATRTPKAGISLTAGLDSRMIMASLDAEAQTVPCYTFGSMYRTTHDVAVGRAVAALCSQPHEEIRLGTEFLAAFPDTFEQSVYIADGHIGMSGAAELYANRRARAIAPVRVTGNWGGELMRGMRAFKYIAPSGGFIDAKVVRRVDASARAFASATSAHPISFTLFHQLPNHGYGRYAIERSQMIMRTPFLANEVVSWLYRAPQSSRRSTESALAVIGRRPSLLSIPTDLGMLGSDFAARWGIRRRYRHVEFKAEYLISHGAPQAIAAFTRTAPGRALETRLLGRHKFQHFRRWIREELADYVRGTLSGADGAALSPWFDVRQFTTMVDAHIAGRANYTDEIDKLMTLAIATKTLMNVGAHADTRETTATKWSNAWIS